MMLENRCTLKKLQSGRGNAPAARPTVSSRKVSYAWRRAWCMARGVSVKRNSVAHSSQSQTNI